MVRIRHFPDLGSVPFQATELPQAAWWGQIIIIIIIIIEVRIMQ